MNKRNAPCLCSLQLPFSRTAICPNKLPQALFRLFSNKVHKTQKVLSRNPNSNQILENNENKKARGNKVQHWCTAARKCNFSSSLRSISPSVCIWGLAGCGKMHFTQSVGWVQSEMVMVMLRWWWRCWWRWWPNEIKMLKTLKEGISQFVVELSQTNKSGLQTMEKENTQSRRCWRHPYYSFN